MWLLLSGEGPSDIGSCAIPGDQCEGPDFRVGPMAQIVDRFVYEKFDYSPIDYGVIRFIPESRLARSGKQLHSKRSLSLPGMKRAKETQYFERHARALAKAAQALAEEKGDSVIAVLFRDSDGTHSSARGLWKNKRDSIVRGFDMEGFSRGVPMVPKPKSEAWLLCAVKEDPYQLCGDLENESGNDRSPNSLKKQLNDAIGEQLGASEWAAKVNNHDIDLDAIDMPSFNDFKKRLFDVLG